MDDLGHGGTKNGWVRTGTGIVREDDPWEIADPAFGGYFGVCPQCGDAQGYINIGRSHWLFCMKHKVKWCIGFDIFPSWKSETAEQQREKYNDLDFASLKRVQPASDSIEYHKVQENEEIEAERIIESQAEENL